MSSAVSDIRQNGFACISEGISESDAFLQTYKAYDALTELISANELVAIALEKTANAWAVDLPRASYFARAPMGYRDRLGRADKEKKSYFQYAPAYAEFVRQSYPSLISGYPEIEWLFAKCDALWESCVRILDSVVLDYDRQYPGVRRLLFRQGNLSPVIIRLIRYEPGDHIESRPHVDKSAFTLHMHSDDVAANQFIIGRWSPDELDLRDLAPIAARTTPQSSNVAVVFPGQLLHAMGYSEILPSPHAALGSKERGYRHVAVGFWLVPFMITDHLVTNVPFRGAA